MDMAKPVSMLSLALALRGLARAVGGVWRDPETKALPFVAGALVLTGTIFYWRFEDWTIIQSLYFSVVTLTTVGYGDLAPTTAGTQIFRSSTSSPASACSSRCWPRSPSSTSRRRPKALRRASV
jgi:voltage-gated potassium channel Kch